MWKVLQMSVGYAVDGVLGWQYTNFQESGLMYRVTKVFVGYNLSLTFKLLLVFEKLCV